MSHKCLPFLSSQSDIEFIKLALRKVGYSEDRIRSLTWAYYKKRVRRSVPAPTELMKNYRRVVAMFANIRDAKTGEPLFRKKAWALYKETCKHIRKGCLSDVPGMSYYYQTGTDSKGIPIFKCIRGTSALEGFHQKIRQLIRGFNISPRFAIAALHEFVYRWNHDIDCRILGLPRRYQNYYDGFEIEEAIDVTADWDDLATPAHAEWFASTRDFGDTGERSGLAAFANEIETADLDCEIEKVVDAIEDGTLDETDDNIHEFDQLPESAAWLGRQLCTARGWGPIRTPDEIKFYRDNHLRFQMQPGSESDADNYSSINFSEVALAFNEAIAAEERGERPKSDMTLKSAYHCSSYHKKFKKDSNASLTLLAVAEANKNLRRELRGTERETAVEMPPAPRVDSLPETQPHSTTDGIPHELDPGSNALIGKQGTSRVRVTKFGALPVGEEIDSYKPMHPHQQAMESKPRGGRRCRKCGHEVRLKPSNHRNSSFKLGKGTIEGKKEMHEVCTVPVSDRLPGFPLLEGVPFPRRSRAKRKKDKSK